jgi:hypothetical protein
VIFDTSAPNDMQAHNSPRTCPFETLFNSNATITMQVPLESPAFLPNAPASHLSASQVNLPHLLEEESEQDHPPLNWNDSIATLLRIGTSRAHVQAEHSEGAKAMLKGELNVEEYIRWLAILWRVYRLALASSNS